MSNLGAVPCCCILTVDAPSFLTNQCFVLLYRYWITRFRYGLWFGNEPNTHCSVCTSYLFVIGLACRNLLMSFQYHADVMLGLKQKCWLEQGIKGLLVQIGMGEASCIWLLLLMIIFGVLVSFTGLLAGLWGWGVFLSLSGFCCCFCFFFSVEQVM